MHLLESTLQLLEIMREAYDSYSYACKQNGLVPVRFMRLPHEVITHLLFSIRFEKSKECDLNFLFLEFIRLGYNPFRKDASLQETIMIKSVISVIDKQRKLYGNRSCKKSKKGTS